VVSSGTGQAIEMAHEECTECGFDGADFDDGALLNALRTLAPRWTKALAEAGGDLRTRPEPAVWSAIEYAAHSRDILALHVFGVDQALTLDEPVYPAIDADALDESAAVTYSDADPAQVGAELGTQACMLADVADSAEPSTWVRGITIDAHRSDVRRLLEHALHDSSHHLADVGHGLVRIRARRVGSLRHSGQ
jgi:hypothetical protein